MSRVVSIAGVLALSACSSSPSIAIEGATGMAPMPVIHPAYNPGDGALVAADATAAAPEAGSPHDGTVADAATSRRDAVPTGDANAADASSCGALSACCAELAGSQEGICQSIVAAGNGADCQGELTDLETLGSCPPSK
jgi:hypothetical protein